MEKSHCANGYKEEQGNNVQKEDSWLWISAEIASLRPAYMTCLVCTGLWPLQQLHIQFFTIYVLVHLLPPPHPLWSIFLCVGDKHCDFLFFLWCVVNPPLCNCNSGTKFTHIHSEICLFDNLVVLQAISNKKLSEQWTVKKAEKWRKTPSSKSYFPWTLNHLIREDSCSLYGGC